MSSYEIDYKIGTLSADALNKELDEMWGALREDGALREEAAAAGIDLAEIDALERSPIEVRSDEAGFDPVSIVIVVAGIVAKDLWKEVLLPRIRARYGAEAVGPERDVKQS